MWPFWLYLSIGCVKYGLHHKNVHSSLHQSLRLLSVSCNQLIKCCREKIKIVIKNIISS